MKIKLSKSQWEEMGKKAGWFDKKDPTLFTDPDLEQHGKREQIAYWVNKIQEDPNNIEKCPNDIKSEPAIQAALKTGNLFKNKDTNFPS